MPHTVDAAEDTMMRLAAALEYTKLGNGKTNLNAPPLKPYTRLVVGERWAEALAEHTDSEVKQTVAEYEASWQAPVVVLSHQTRLDDVEMLSRSGASLLRRAEGPEEFVDYVLNVLYTHLLDFAGARYDAGDTGMLFGLARVKPSPDRLLIVHSCFYCNGAADNHILQRLDCRHYTFEIWCDDETQSAYAALFNAFNEHVSSQTMML